MNKTKEILRANQLRPTKQRVLIGNFLFDGIDKHVTAESLFKQLSNESNGVSLATVYNTLHEFCKPCKPHKPYKPCKPYKAL